MERPITPILAHSNRNMANFDPVQARPPTEDIVTKVTAAQTTQLTRPSVSQPHTNVHPSTQPPSHTPNTTANKWEEGSGWRSQFKVNAAPSADSY